MISFPPMPRPVTLSPTTEAYNIHSRVKSCKKNNLVLGLKLNPQDGEVTFKV
jgi:hypothetical protein